MTGPGAATDHIQDHQRLGIGVLLLGGAFTGATGILIRLSEVGPIATAAWRMLIASLILAAVAAVSDAQAFRFHGRGILLVAGLLFAIDMAFFHWALVLTSVAHATLITNLAPLVALGAGVVLFGESLGPTKLVGLFASMAGAALMTVMRLDVAGTLSGNAVAVLGMLAYASYLIVVKKAVGAESALTVLLWSSVTAAVALFALATMTGDRLLPSTGQGWAVLVAMGVFAHVLGQGLIAVAMGHVPVGLASVLLLIQPVVAATGAWVLFGESLGPLETAGALLVLAGLSIASRAKA